MLRKRDATVCSIIHTWLTEGRLEDFRDEFLVFKNPASRAVDSSAIQENFWADALSQRDYETRLMREGIQPAALLQQLMPRIFQAGKSIEILARLDRLSAPEVMIAGVDAENNQQLTHPPDLYEEVLASIRHRLRTASKPAEADSGSLRGAAAGQPLENRFQEIVHTVADDEYLAKAFASMFVSGGLLESCHLVQREKEDANNSPYLLGDCQLDPLR
jgi:hypothetical protein